MTAQLSRERLEEIRDFDTCVTLEESAEMARMLLAGMESEPVGYYRKGSDGFYLSSATIQREGTVPLYAAPPAPVAVPDVAIPHPSNDKDEIAYNAGWNESRQYAITNRTVPHIVKGISAHCRGWNAFRAAMLKAGPVTAATVPDGWKLVPVEPTEAMLDAAYSHPASTEDRMRKQYVSMLAAAPAAPEQEV